MKTKSTIALSFFIIINIFIFVEALLPGGSSTTQSEGILGVINGIAQSLAPDRFDYIKVDSVSLNGKSEAEVNESNYEYTSIVLPDNASFPAVVFESRTPELMTITPQGVATYIKAGLGKIRVYCEDNPLIYDEMDILIKEETRHIESVEISDKKLTLKKNYSYDANIIVNPTSEKAKLRYNSSDETIATFEKGVIRTYQEGMVTFRVSSILDESKFDEFSAEITPEVAVQPTSLSLKLNDKYHVNRWENLEVAFGGLPDDRNLIYMLGDATLADFGSQQIKGLKSGTTTLKICNLFDQNVCSASETLVIEDVFPSNLAVEVKNNPSTFNIGQSYQLICTTNPSDVTNRDFVWSVDDDNIAKISTEGMLLGLKSGTVNVNVSHEDSGMTYTRSFSFKKANALSPEEQRFLHHQIRKVIGHFGLFALDGFVGYLFFASLDLKKSRQGLALVTLGISCSVIAELLQLIPVGRACQLSDMLINAGGFLGGVLCALFVFWIIKKVKAHKKSQ